MYCFAQRLGMLWTIFIHSYSTQPHGPPDQLVCG